MSQFHNDIYRNPDLTVQETAFKLNCSIPTIYKMIYDGKLKSYKLGRTRRVTRESVSDIRNST